VLDRSRELFNHPRVWEEIWRDDFDVASDGFYFSVGGCNAATFEILLDEKPPPEEPIDPSSIGVLRVYLKHANGLQVADWVRHHPNTRAPEHPNTTPAKPTTRPRAPAFLRVTLGVSPRPRGTSGRLT
jgi:hypothetical protein